MTAAEVCASAGHPLTWTLLNGTVHCPCGAVRQILDPHALHLQALDSPVGLVVDATCNCGTWGAAFLLSEQASRATCEDALARAHDGHRRKAST